MESVSSILGALVRDRNGEISPQNIVKLGLALYGGYTLLKQAGSYITLENLLNVIPGASGAIDATLKSEVKKTVKDMFVPLVAEENVLHSIPEKGQDREELYNILQQWSTKEAKSDGTYFAYVYDTQEKEITDFIYSIFKLYSNTNALSPVAFPALRKMEVDVCRMTASLLNAPSTAVGAITSGGTESIICALKAYRDRARASWPHITKPEVVFCETVHPAFPKGCHILGITPVFVPQIKSGDYNVDMNAYAASITHNTILLVASAPSYPHGLIEPVGAICHLASDSNNKSSRHLPVHVDACIGGFALPFIERLGYPIPSWDFRHDNVTSISADLHKYAYTPKGASCLVWRYEEDRKYQFYTQSTWPGGLFVSPSLLGTRGGGPIASSWAALNAYGIDGFTKLMKKVMIAKEIFINGLTSMPEFQLIGTPQSTIIAWTSSIEYLKNNPTFNILCVADAMEKSILSFKDGTTYTLSHKWGIERQQNPICIHMTLMPPHATTLPDFLIDIRYALRYVLENPSMADSGSAAMYGTVAKIPSNTIIDKFLLEFENQVMNNDIYEHVMDNDVKQA